MSQLEIKILGFAFIASGIFCLVSVIRYGITIL